jgi:hypothetical protein
MQFNDILDQIFFMSKTKCDNSNVKTHLTFITKSICQYATSNQ